MLLADFAQVRDGKLTVVGGGWSLTGPEPAPFGIAILIRVPWDQANQRHVMRLELLDADGQPVEIDAETDGGRSRSSSSTTSRSRSAAPPASSRARRSTSPSRSTRARCSLEPGRYEWRLTIDDEADDDWRLPFSVRHDEEIIA